MTTKIKSAEDKTAEDKTAEDKTAEDKTTEDKTTEDLGIKLEDPGLDLESLRLSQDFQHQIGVEKVLNKVPVRKPTKQEFFRVRPEPEYRIDTSIIEIKEDREFYLLDPAVRDKLPGDWDPVRIYVAINRQGVVFLMPCKLSKSDGRVNAWFETALQAAETAMTKWIKMVADMGLGGYQIYAAQGELSEPEWPDYSFAKLLEIAFRGKIIRDIGHPVIKRLLGLE